jgi:hypothetical protein
VIAEREAANEADRVRDDQIGRTSCDGRPPNRPAAPRGPVLTREQNVED